MELTGAGKEDDACHRPVACRRCLNSRERCSVLHFSSWRSPGCVLCSLPGQSEVPWLSWAGLRLQPGQCAAVSEAERLQSMGMQLVLGTSAPSCFWPKQHFQSHRRGDNRLGSTRSYWALCCWRLMGLAQVEGTGCSTNLGGKTQSRHGWEPLDFKRPRLHFFCFTKL